MDKVEVFWLDAGFENSNMSFEDAKNLKPMERTSVGYLVSKDKDVLRLAFGIVNDKDHSCSVLSDILVIPRGDVKKIKKLK